MMAWGFWYRCNQWMYEEQVLTPDQVLEHALSLYQENKAVAEALKLGQRYRCSWQPPPSSVLKLNVDGATFSDQCRSCIGVVLRDDKGHVLFVANKPENALADLMEIELELQKEGFSSTLWGSLVQEIKSLLNRHPTWNVQHKRREANGVAHALARFAWNLNDIVLLWDSVPNCISQATWADLSL
ncbi:hypothetical protein CIPAW_01G086600 [Carya illinoinensis]|uniref:RNase H type-1 domain-containing protein n=1 Tax=Carya illinoinensis TaxID=32201 RepID=A0A8T1RK67_CARIL|nr:hypothetical protein CIPAW_01G086600 [Carya illinoinensis]